jgi:peptide/nickel transport system substrate-binding protein
MRSPLTASLTLILLVAACAPASAPSTQTAAPPQAPAVKQRLTASIFSDPPGMFKELTNPGGTTGSVPGLAELSEMMHSGASYLDDQDVLQPRLAQAVPSADNGLWKVLPDGKMETTWKLKPNIAWHDGTPLTAADFVFGVKVNGDKEIGIFNPAPLAIIDAVEAPDPATVLIRWKEPFIEADSMFTPGFALPLPRHILEKPFNEDKLNFLNLAYWNQEYIGVGAFKLKDWVPGSHMTLVANDKYILGRPRLDEVEVRFMSDFNTVMANILAEAIDKHIGRGFGVEQATQIRDQAKDHNVLLGGLLGGIAPMFPQFVNPDPPIIANLEFRRALLMAIDRQEMNDTINYGLGTVAHSWLQPDRAEYPAVEKKIVKYDYDPRRSAQMIESLGYTKAADGIYRDAAGQKLHIELRTTDQLLIQPRSAFTVADYWKRLGLDVDTNNVPNQLIPDREYRSQFPAFELVLSGHTVKSTAIRQYQSASTPLPSTRFAGANRARYQNPLLDALIDIYVATIPMGPRLELLGDALHIQTDQLSMVPLFYQGSFAVLGSNRLKGVTSAKVWNANEWYLT